MTNANGWAGNHRGRGLIVLAAIGGVLILLLFLLRLSAALGGPGISTYSIPAGSMFPSVQRGDYIAALSNVYRDQVPPRGQIVTFKFPQDRTTDYIKRVIGLPGDRIQLRGGRLYINDRQAAREPAPDVGKLGDPRLIIYRETLPGGARHLIAELGDDEQSDSTQVFVVPDGYVFMLGDNRDNSSDSRFGVGYVPLSLLRDKPLFVFWSAAPSRIGATIE